MAENKQGAQPTEPTGTEPHGTEPTEPEKDWKAEYEKVLAQSRKWEQRSKDNAAAAKELDEMRKQSMSDAERAESEKARADKAEAKLAEYERERVRAAIVSEVAAAKGVDSEWLGRMTGDDRKAIEANADYIATKLSGQPIYPSVPDRGQAKTPPMTKEQIESIKDPRERVRMRARHIDLYK